MVPLTRWLSLRHGLRFDNGIPLGGASLLPKVERFFAGGDTMLRGFKLDCARIEEVRFQIYPGVDGVEYRPLGGNLRILQNIDLQFPMSPPFYGAVFMDNGVVADSLDGLSPRQFRHGVGGRRCCEAAHRRPQLLLGLAARSGSRRHRDRRPAREHRAAVLERVNS